MDDEVVRRLAAGGGGEVEPPFIIIARHGETQLNGQDGQSAERIRGWINVPLNLNGVMQAKQLSNQLVQTPIHDIISSDLERAAQTARAVSSGRDIPITMTTALRPWNLGHYQGQEVKDVIPQISRLISNPTEPAPNGETFNDFRGRYLSTLSHIMDYAAQLNRGVMLATHTRNAQLTKAWFAAGQKPDFSVDKNTLIDYANQPKTGHYFLMKPSVQPGKWQLHIPPNA